MGADNHLSSSPFPTYSARQGLLFSLSLLVTDLCCGFSHFVHVQISSFKIACSSGYIFLALSMQNLS